LNSALFISQCSFVIYVQNFWIEIIHLILIILKNVVKPCAGHGWLSEPYWEECHRYLAVNVLIKERKGEFTRNTFYHCVILLKHVFTFTTTRHTCVTQLFVSRARRHICVTLLITYICTNWLPIICVHRLLLVTHVINYCWLFI